MKIVVKNWKAESVGDMELSEAVFSLPVRKDILARVIHWQLAKRQSGNHKTKGMGEVSGTTKKPWKQKGTGRARAGSLRAPQFRGGGTVFGPVVRDHGYSLQKKVRQLGLKTALSCKFSEGRLMILDDLRFSQGKTKEALRGLQALGVTSALVVGDAEGDGMDSVKNALCNIARVDFLPHVGINVYDILKHEYLILSRHVVESLQERFT